MYAVIKTGGKQYKVSKDDVISIEKLSDDAGKKIKFRGEEIVTWRIKLVEKWDRGVRRSWGVLIIIIQFIK